MPQITLELLESLSSGHLMTPDELDDLLSNQVTEDLYLEYKHGDKLKNKKEAAQTIREYMSGFANSAGGVLIIGVDETNWAVTGATAPGGGDLAEWAVRCLTPIASYFSPVPRFQVLNHPEGNVLIATTARSLGVVPCIEAGQLAHYFRIHDQTLKAPEYLISDILLGRRRQPYLQITEVSFNHVRAKHDDQGNYYLYFTPILKVENQGLLRAKNVRVGIVSLVVDRLSHPSLLSNHLLTYINVTDRPIGPFDPLGPCSHEVQSTADIEPFSVVAFGNFGHYKVPISRHNDFVLPYIWKAAVYLTSEEGPPIWYQLDLMVKSQLLQILKSHGGGSIAIAYDSQFHNIERLVGSQPSVTFERTN